MEIIIDYSNGKYKQTIIERTPQKRVRRSNSTSKMRALIESLPNNPRLVEMRANDIKIIYNRSNSLTLKSYKKHIDSRLYHAILDGIDEATPIVKKVNYNKKRIATLALTTVTLIGSIHLAKQVLDKSDISTTQTVVQENIIENEIPKIEQEFALSYNNVIEDDLEKPVYEALDNTLNNRLEQTLKVINNEVANSSTIPISTKIDNYTINKIKNFLNSDDGNYFLKTANDFGIDPYIFLCLIMKESSLSHETTIPGGSNYNGFGVGICQLESPNGQKITAFNYTTSEEETIYETLDNAIDKKTNIKMGIMRYQKVLEKYHGNEKMALQSYNYGQGLMDLIVAIYADETGRTFDDVVVDYNDIGWIKYVKMVHNDPIGFAKALDENKYSNFKATINYLKNWQHGTYGDANYIAGVNSFYIGTYGDNIVDNEIVRINHLTDEVVRFPKDSLDNSFKIS